MSETLDMLVVVAGCAVYAVMLIVPVVENAAARSRLGGVIRGGWMVSESGRQYFCHTTCHAPDMELYRENLKSRRRGNGF